MKIIKLTLIIFLCFAMLASLCSCSHFSSTNGITEGVQIKIIPSKIYTRQDIDAAIDIILKEFQANWKGCKLTSICYAGDNKTADESNYYLQEEKVYNADELIILTSSFDVDSSGGDGSLNANSTYTDWMWILVRSKGGEWQHVDHGY